ncbi:MAG: redoxin domain-containing protein [Acidobacteriia bacterium]|nr:redoxin domain-containing protein [Terriglobia bacterium]
MAGISNERTAKRVELVANVGIVIVALLAATLLLRNNLGHQSNPQSIVIGSKIKLKDVNWKANGKTLVLALSTNCHFCTESAPFYRQLVKAAEEKNVRTVAVFPQSPLEATSYLAAKAVKVDLVQQSPLPDIQVSGTPTVLLVNENGEVKAVWIGKLQAEREKDLLGRLGSS